MSKVITFNTQFPGYHPKAGKPTLFVEKVIKSLDKPEQYRAAYKYGYNCAQHAKDHKDALDTFGAMSDLFLHNLRKVDPKSHTIRAGHRWRPGVMFSPRIWSGRPYHDKQLTFSSDLQIMKIWRLDMDPAAFIDECKFYLDGTLLDQVNLVMVANNDGLELRDKQFKAKAIQRPDHLLER